jgi:hypothetical protein
MHPESSEEWEVPDSDFAGEWVSEAELKNAEAGFLESLEQNHGRCPCHSPLMGDGLEDFREDLRLRESNSELYDPEEPDRVSGRAGE